MTFRLACCLPAIALATACGDDSTPAADAGGPDATIPPAIGQFPTGFLWGTAIAPYQVEGNLHATDWYQWESDRCGTACSGDHADDGPDFWDDYTTDLGNAVAMHNNSIRLGIEWARVFPTQAAWDTMTPDAAAVQHYHDILAAARMRGLEPMVTLFHFSSPSYLSDLNDFVNHPGWESPAMATEFAKYAGWAAGEYGAQVDWWVTENEPLLYAVTGWFAASTPPGKSGDVQLAIQVVMNLIEGHARAYDAIHAADAVDADGDGKAALVSIAQHSRVFLPKNPMSMDDVRAASVLRYLFNQVMLDGIVYGKKDENVDMVADEIDPEWSNRADWIGLNYYGVSIVVATGSDTNYPVIGIPFQNDLDDQGLDNPITDFGWSIYPEGFRTVLDEVASYQLPIVITENGIADVDDDQRPRFIVQHLYELGRAIDDGLDIRGYMHWSLVDNFEWTSGYCPHFGLYHFDHADPQKVRTRGAGADVYQQIIDANTVPVELFAEYPDYPLAKNPCVRVGP
jgi:beta-glucosidase/6-phospho-beta-glucosidase/beta-galactosidase